MAWHSSLECHWCPSDRLACGLGRAGFGVTEFSAVPAWNPELAKFTAAVESAAAVQIQLGAAVKDFRRKWTWVVAFAIAGMVLAAALVAYGAAWWQLRELGQLQVQRDQLRTEVNGLQEQAEQARRNNGRKPTGK